MLLIGVLEFEEACTVEFVESDLLLDSGEACCDDSWAETVAAEDVCAGGVTTRSGDFAPPVELRDGLGVVGKSLEVAFVR